jgi:hypothetical protein
MHPLKPKNYVIVHRIDTKGEGRDLGARGEGRGARGEGRGARFRGEGLNVEC